MTGRKTIFGAVIVIGIALSWVGSTQFAKSTYSPTFNAPFFTTWFSTCWMVAVFPAFYLFSLTKRRKGILQFYRESETVFGSTGLNWKTFIKYSGQFCMIWMIANYSYVTALGKIDAADVTAMFSSCSAFVYVLSWLLLDERVSIIRFFAVALSIGGIVLMASVEGFTGPSAVGVLYSVTAALAAALYKVLFKKIVGDASGPQVSLFLTFLGLLNLVFLWPIMLILHYTNYEHMSWDTLPWDFLAGTGGLGLVFNFLINFGVALTYPLFISLGTVLGIPINAIADALFRGQSFGRFKIIASIMIVIGFVLLLLPERYEDLLESKVCCRKGKKRNTER